MKKFFAAIMIFALVTCSSFARAAAVDIDLTKMSSTMVYSTVLNMVNNPAAFAGKTMRMSGQYNTYNISVDDPKQKIHACIVRDALGCCSQGLEFVLSNGNYPSSEFTEITVVGTIAVQKIFGKYVCYIKDAALE